jgi:hypothetical protein
MYIKASVVKWGITCTSTNLSWIADSLDNVKRGKCWFNFEKKKIYSKLEQNILQELN